jgi:tetratricopeptide (TPR) repeat protein
VVLLLGLVVGLASALGVQAGKGARPIEAMAALSARKGSLLEQLREHDGDKSKTDPTVWAQRREALLSEAAEVLRQLDEGPADLVFEPGKPAGGKVTLFWMVGLVAFFGVAAGLVSQFASQRPDDDMAAPRPSATDPYAADVARAQAALALDSNDLSALNTLSHVAIEKKSLQEAMAYIDRAKAIAPDDAEVRVHFNALRLMIGRVAEAQASLEEIIAEHPDMSEAMRWMSYARFSTGDLDGAVIWLEKAAQAGSELERKVAQAWLLELRAARTQMAMTGQSSAGSESVSESVSETVSQAPSGAPSLQGSIQLGSGLSVPTGGVLFVLARAAATERGPPLAAVKLGQTALPTEFSLGVGDLIRGGTWPEQVWIKAKWSASGDPMTTQSGDLVTELVGPYSVGSEGLTLVLQAAP